MSPATAPTAVLLLMFDDMELLDFAGPFEVLTTATRVHARHAGAGAMPLFQVHTVSPAGRPVRARAGLTIQADHALTHLHLDGGVSSRVEDLSGQYVIDEAHVGNAFRS